MAISPFVPAPSLRPPYQNRLTPTAQSVTTIPPIAPASWSVPRPTVPPSTATTNPAGGFFGTTPEAAASINPISLPRVPGANPIIEGQFQDAESLRQQLAADSARYREAISGATPALERQNEQQLEFLASVFGGDYARQLAAVRAKRAAAMGNLNNQILAETRQALNLNALGGQGVSGSGLGSYLTGVAAREAGRLRTAEAYDAAEAERADLNADFIARMQTVGRPQQLTDAMAARVVQPAQFDISANAALQAAYERALQQALANQTFAFGMQP